MVNELGSITNYITKFFLSSIQDSKKINITALD